jgi:hypothetical protein
MRWICVCGAFVAASAVQVLIFAAQASHAVVSWLPGVLVVAGSIAWLVVPAAVATLIATRLLRSRTADGRGYFETSASLALLLLPPASIYLGVFVSFNTWGGK